ncbi:MAG: D-aminoacyl-tRNA deacylase [Alphaproteobacteria bacterium]|nr:D-aminoacyl-tRNA deacylase [Alphaproteobacteria bacterium]
MRVVLQRVTKSAVSVEGRVVGQIGRGFCLLLGVAPADTEEDVGRMVQKVVGLRVFEDENRKMNRSLQDIGGEALVISQFTLLADCNTGRRPSFTGAGSPENANQLYQLFVRKMAEAGIPTQTGIFAADMSVEIHNDGPATFILESPSK